MNKNELISLLGNTSTQVNDELSNGNIPSRRGDLDFYPKTPNRIVSFSRDGITNNWVYRTEQGSFTKGHSTAQHR